MRSQGTELRLRHLSEQLRTKDAEIAALRSQINLLASDFKYNLKLLKERDWELDQNEHQMKEMLKKIADKEKENKASVIELAKCREASERDRGCIQELKETLTQYQDAVHTVRQRLEEARQMRDQELSHHHSEREQLHGKLQKQAEEHAAELEAARKEAAAACERKWSKLLHECNQSVASLVSEKGTLLLQKRQLEKEIESLRNQVSQLQQTVAELSSSSGESRQELGVLRDQLETLKVEIHRKVEELENERRRIGELELERQGNKARIAELEHERCRIEESVRQRLGAEHESAVQNLYSQLQYAEHTLAVERGEAESRLMEENENHMRELEKLHHDAEQTAKHYAKEVKRLQDDAQNHASIYAKELEKLKEDAQSQASMFASEIGLLKQMSRSNTCQCQSRTNFYKGEEQQGRQGPAIRKEKDVDSGKTPWKHHSTTGNISSRGRVGEVAYNSAVCDHISNAGSCSDEASDREDEDAYATHEVGDLDISPAEASSRFSNDPNHYRVRMVLEAENRFLRERLKELQLQNETVGKIILDLRQELETAGLLKPSRGLDGNHFSAKVGPTPNPLLPPRADASPRSHSPRKLRPMFHQASGPVPPAPPSRKDSFKEEPSLSLADREELQLLRSYYGQLSAESDQLDYPHAKPASAASSAMCEPKRSSFTPEFSLSQRHKIFSPGAGHHPASVNSREASELTARQQQCGLSPRTGHQRHSMSRECLQERDRLIERRFQDTKKKIEKNLSSFQERAGRISTPVLGHQNAVKTTGPFCKKSSSSESGDDSCLENFADDSDSSVDNSSHDAIRRNKVYRRTPLGNNTDVRSQLKS